MFTGLILSLIINLYLIIKYFEVKREYNIIRSLNITKTVDVSNLEIEIKMKDRLMDDLQQRLLDSIRIENAHLYPLDNKPDNP